MIKLLSKIFFLLTFFQVQSASALFFGPGVPTLDGATDALFGTEIVGTTTSNINTGLIMEVQGNIQDIKSKYKEYIGKVIENTKIMCEEFISMGYKVVTGGTDNHLFLLDLSDLGITGKAVQDACDKHNITLNKNCIPGDRQSPKLTSGIRIGCAAETTRGKTAEDFRHIAHNIDKIIKTEIINTPID